MFSQMFHSLFAGDDCGTLEVRVYYALFQFTLPYMLLVYDKMYAMSQNSYRNVCLICWCTRYNAELMQAHSASHVFFFFSAWLDLCTRVASTSPGCEVLTFACMAAEFTNANGPINLPFHFLNLFSHKIIHIDTHLVGQALAENDYDQSTRPKLILPSKCVRTYGDTSHILANIYLRIYEYLQPIPMVWMK